MVATVYLHPGNVGERGMMCVFMTSSVILLNNSTSPDATCFIRISLAQLASKKKGWTPLCGEQWFTVCVNSNSSPIALLYACIECFNLVVAAVVLVQFSTCVAAMLAAWLFANAVVLVWLCKHIPS